MPILKEFARKVRVSIWGCCAQEMMQMQGIFGGIEWIVRFARQLWPTELDSQGAMCSICFTAVNTTEVN